MHKDPALAVQKLILDTLKSDPAVTAVVSGRIYDQVPSKVTFPFIQIGDDDFEYEYLAATANSVIRLYSDSVGFPAVKGLGAAVFNALLNLDDPEMLDDWHLDRIDRVSAQYMSDLDSSTQMGELVLSLNVSH